MSRTGRHPCRHISDFHLHLEVCGRVEYSLVWRPYRPRPSAERGGRVRRTTSGLRSTRSMLVATASRFNNPAVALLTRSTISGRRNTASSRVRRSGRSSRTAVRSRICCCVISSALSRSEAISASRSIKPSASPRQRRWRISGSLSGDLPARVILFAAAARGALPSTVKPISRAASMIAARRFDQCPIRSSGIPAIRVNSPSFPYCFHADAEALLQAPGHCVAVDCSRCLHPCIDRVLMQRPVLAVPVCTGGIENHTMSMKLRIVVPACAMLEHRGGYVSRQDLDIAVPVTDAGIPAMPQHRLLKCYTRGIVMRLLDLRTQPGVGDRPTRPRRLLSVLKVMSRPADRRSLPAFWVRLPPVFGAKPLYSRWKSLLSTLPPSARPNRPFGLNQTPSGFLTRRVVLVGMTEGALAFQVVRRRCGLGQSGYHDVQLCKRRLPWQGYNLAGVQLEYDYCCPHDSSL